MAELSKHRIFSLNAQYCGLISLFAFLYLLPIHLASPLWAAPDLIMGLTYVWSLRRPHDIPILLIAFVIFMADLLFQRPPGLMAAIIVIGCEFLRSRSPFTRDATIVIEWFIIGVVVASSFLVNRLVLSLVLVPTLPLSTELMQIAMTVISYPLIVILFRWTQGIATGDTSSSTDGRRSKS